LKNVIVDYRISEEEKNEIHKLGYEILVCPPSHDLYDAVCGHPDILMHIADSNNIIVHKNMPESFVLTLEELGYNVYFSKKALTRTYPYDIILNALNIGNFFVHNLNNTDENLLHLLSCKKLLNVRQGYTKCSAAVLNENAVMTSDKGIADVLSANNVDVLLLPPGDILLPGLNYGFIGGTCGMLSERFIAFYGQLSEYKYGEEVLKFLKKYNIEPVYLRKGKLIDRGSLFTISGNK
jgi:hypothetical protein